MQKSISKNVFFGVSAFWAFLITCGLTLADTYRPLSTNGTFTQGLTGWTRSTGGTIVINQTPQTWTFNPSNGSDVLGGNKVQMTGASSIWQLVPLTVSEKFHILNCNAFKQSTNSAPPGWAGYGVIYFDSGFFGLGDFSKQIAVGDDLSTNPFRRSSLGVQVPANAAYALIWAANDGGSTRSHFDNLTLLGFTPSPLSSSKTILETNTYPFDTVIDTSAGIHDLSGLQFWELFGCIDSGTGQVGVIGQSSSIAREIDAKAGIRYWAEIETSGREPGAPAVNFGVDFYDSLWRRIGGGYIPIGQPTTTGFYLHDFTPPTGTVHSIAWFWVDSLTSYENRAQLDLLSLKIALPDLSPPTITLRTPISPAITTNTISARIILDYRDDSALGELTNGVEIVGPTGKRLPMVYSGPLFDPNQGFPDFNALTFTTDVRVVQWSNEPLGTYRINLTSTGITDKFGNAAKSVTLGTFNLTAGSVLSRTTPSVRKR
jgi:hypothetical protein